MGTWVVVIATRAGLAVAFRTRRPDGRNCKTCVQRSRSPLLSVHSSLRRLGGNAWTPLSHPRGNQRRFSTYHSRLSLIILTFHAGNRATGSDAYAGSNSSNSSRDIVRLPPNCAVARTRVS